MDLENAVAVVAGGAGGIGAAISEGFARRGSEVAVVDTNRLSSAVNHYRSVEVGGFDAAERLAARLCASGARVEAIAADAANEGEVVALFDRVRERFGRLDVLVNAFGITHVARIADLDLAAFRAVLEGNLVGTFLMCKHAIALMRERASGGTIINISSISGRAGFARVSHYCAAKFGIVGLTSSLAQEVAKDGIRVNAICPGIVRTRMWDYLLDEFTRPNETREQCWARMCAMIPQGVPQSCDDIADAVIMLAASDRITGQAVSVDGGMYGAP